ncbi:MAG: NUDIX hydrolase, partial [Flavobacteriaceae bacterium]|nr:NUDIX hydrolase [Flavobacteriaceae bacterium]
IFKKGNKYYLKETTWFNMETDYDDELRPEFKEDITKVVWKSKSQIKNIKNTYPNIKLLLEI